MHARSHLQQASQRQDNPVAGDEALKCMVRLLEGAGGMMHEDGERAYVKMLHAVKNTSMCSWSPFFDVKGWGCWNMWGKASQRGKMRLVVIWRSVR